MLNKCFSVKDDSFSNGILASHHLSMKVSAGTLENAVLDVKQNMIVAHETWVLHHNEDFANFRDAFEKIVSESFILGWHYNKVNVVIDTAVYTLIPDKLFQVDEARKYLEFNHSSVSAEAVFTDNIESIAVKNIYQVPCAVENICKQTFPNFNFRNSCSILLNSILKNKEAGVTLFVHFSGKRFDVIATNNGSLQFCNSFSFTTAQDIIFFILNIYQKLGFDPSSMPIILAGEITQDSSAYEIIYRYIRNVSFAKRPAEFKFCEDIDELPEQMYYDLFHSFQNV